MEGKKGYSARRNINVVILNRHVLTCSGLKILIESKNKSIHIVNTVKSPKELMEFVSNKDIDIVLFCLLEDDLNNIDVIPELLSATPNTKIVIILPPNDSLDQTKLLKIGVSGIVGCDQKEEVLIRAIEQVSEGGVWLNQKIIAQLLGNGSGSTNGHAKQKEPFANDRLTNREMEVVGEIGKGLTNRQISDKLFISEATVRHHLSSIYGKLQVDDRLNLVIYVFQKGIVGCAPRNNKQFQ